MTTGKRLFRYALNFKGIIIGALIMLTIAVFADLAGPFVAKKVIDDHITDIESVWYETSSSEQAVSFNGTYYKKDANFLGDEEKLSSARIVQVGRELIFVEGDFSPEGKKSFSNGILTITYNDSTSTYTGTELTKSEVFSFYKPEITPIMKLLGFYFVLVCISAVFQYGQHYLLQKSANRIIQKMREDIFNQIQRLPINYFDNLPAGKVVARVTNDTEAIRELYVTVLSNFFSSGINIIGIYIALFILNSKLAAICLILLPILYVWMIGYRKFASRYNHVIRAKISDINGMVNESIQGMHIIQAYGKEKQMKAEFEELNKEHFQYQNKMLNLNSLTSHNLVNVLRNIVFVLFIWYVAGQSLSVNVALSLGVLYAFVDYINRLFQPVQGIVNQLANLEQALVAGDRVFELLDEEGIDVKEPTVERYKGNVKFDQVYFAYKEKDYVLKDITFEAKQGDTVALVGHTGSGKSSIMNLLFRFYDIQSGTISIDGKDITTMSRQDLRKHMGIVLQDPFLFKGTVFSNVTLNDPSITREMVEKSLKDVGADRVLKDLENGYDEPVIEKGSTLSSGQRQLISFARALAFNPAILILDEATSSIDTETEQIIQKAMDVLKKGRTTFIIAHRLSTIRNADQIIVLDHGEIVEKGNHEELMKEKGRYYQMYQMQQGEDLVS
ncbi:ABC transporter ATP-binding protein [Bacillus sp. B1-b2]|uniref:ABC transporter ATP-binding protein n=1 Tax=Bacillus sp. B1-b2 TaxID=2653201 RepID=UPI00126206FC|nr:ABC transporter ATP-binding protein [Bacillus sp. B1-b2]KAB7666868.1 ABC transporter ATP-binding protein [Bacillus sp. B1-b2]